MKPSPVALKNFELLPQRMSLPINLDSLFGATGERFLEIGFGGGEFLAYLAKRSPQKHFIGIEFPPESILRLSRVLYEQSIPNVRLIRGDGRYLLRELFQSQSFDKVLMQFPMPWPKDKHAKHRVMTGHLVDTLADILKVGGRFELVSDQEWYAREGYRLFSESSCFDAGLFEINPNRDFFTRYEEKWRLENRNTYRFCVTLLKSRKSDRIFLNKKMKKYSFENIPARKDIHSLSWQRFNSAESSCEIKEVLSRERTYLLRMVAADGQYSQFFNIRLRQRKKDDTWVMAIDDSPFPYYTEAVRFALDAVCEALKKLLSS